jgi:dihydroflavonol-4-reductase
MIVSVTGASGHVGSNLCRMLLKRGHKVRALVHRDETGLQGLDLEKVHGDVLNTSVLQELFNGSDVVIHLAAIISIKGKRNKYLEEVNIEGTRNVIKAIEKNGVKRLIHFSSIHAINHFPLSEPMDESRPFVNNFPLPYEKAKSLGEKIVMNAVRETGLDAIVLNPTAIIGPYDFKPSLMGQLVKRLYKRQLPALVKGGYNWVDVRDVSIAAINAIESGKSGERYILSGIWAGLTDLSRMVSDITGRKTPTLVTPMWLAKVGVPFISTWYALKNEHPLYTFQSLEIINSVNKNIINKKAREDLDFDPRPLEDTLRDTIDWFIKENKLD